MNHLNLIKGNAESTVDNSVLKQVLKYSKRLLGVIAVVGVLATGNNVKNEMQRRGYEIDLSNSFLPKPYKDLGIYPREGISVGTMIVVPQIHASPFTFVDDTSGDQDNLINRTQYVIGNIVDEFASQYDVKFVIAEGVDFNTTYVNGEILDLPYMYAYRGIKFAEALLGRERSLLYNWVMGPNSNNFVITGMERADNLDFIRNNYMFPCQSFDIFSGLCDDLRLNQDRICRLLKARIAGDRSTFDLYFSSKVSLDVMRERLINWRSESISDKQKVYQGALDISWDFFGNLASSGEVGCDDYTISQENFQSWVKTTVEKGEYSPMPAELSERIIYSRKYLGDNFLFGYMNYSVSEDPNNSNFDKYIVHDRNTFVVEKATNIFQSGETFTICVIGSDHLLDLIDQANSASISVRVIYPNIVLK